MSAHGAEHWQRVAAIFDELVEAPADSRAQLLDRLCDGDAALRAEVAALLRADEQADAREFEQSVGAVHASAISSWNASDEATQAADGQRIGPWRVLRELGRGGMGVVLLGERADGQYEQRAALKLVKRGMDSEAILSRFLRERQILARLEHPHIAHLLDGGIAEDARPYFAMEYVEGEPLLQYCAAHGLGLRDRIGLFLQICAAVQFAHAQLIVHRDIKPSNILVTPVGEAKLLDFGIAKLLDPAQRGATATIDAQHRPLTPAYAAPEQWSGEAVNIATDIYALGAVLYELLSGQRPFNLGDSPTAEEIQRVLAATSPAAPSQLRANLPGVAARNLRGDLDTIVLKSLKREPERRYATVEAFAADLRRYLEGRPIAARRDSTRYRLGKFIARHRLGVALSAIVVVALIASMAFALWQAHEKAREAQVSAEVTRFLIDVFQGADPTLSRGASVSAQELLDRGAEKLGKQTDIVPEVRARLQTAVAGSYVALGLYDRALPLAQQALAERQQAATGDEAGVAESLDQVGQIFRLKADYTQAQSLLEQALAMRRRILPQDDASVIDSLGNVGALLQYRGDFAAADRAYFEALAAAERRFGAESTQAARRLDDYAGNLDDSGKSAQAEPFYRRALAIRENQLGADDAQTATALQNLGVHYDNAGNFQAALPLLERAVAIRKKIFGPAHPLFASAELSLAGVYQSLGRLDDCERAAQEALVVFRRSLPEDHPKILESLNQLGLARQLRRDYAGAIPLMSEVAALEEKTQGPAHPDTLAVKNNLAYALLHAGQFDKAEQLLREVVKLKEASGIDMVGAMDEENLATVFEMQGKHAQAVIEEKKAVEIQKRREGEVSGNVAVALRARGVAEELNGEAVAAERDLRAALAMIEQFAASRPQVGIYPMQIALADFLAGQGRCREAQPLLQSALKLAAKIELRDDPVLHPQLQLLIGYCEQRDGASRDAATRIASANRTLHDTPGVDVDLYPFSLKLLRDRTEPDSHRPSAPAR